MFRVGDLVEFEAAENPVFISSEPRYDCISFVDYGASGKWICGVVSSFDYELNEVVVNVEDLTWRFALPGHQYYIEGTLRHVKKQEEKKVEKCSHAKPILLISKEFSFELSSSAVQEELEKMCRKIMSTKREWPFCNIQNKHAEIEVTSGWATGSWLTWDAKLVCKGCSK